VSSDGGKSDLDQAGDNPVTMIDVLEHECKLPWIDQD
jgi:hypothetical protein